MEMKKLSIVELLYFAAIALISIATVSCSTQRKESEMVVSVTSPPNDKRSPRKSGNTDSSVSIEKFDGTSPQSPQTTSGGTKSTGYDYVIQPDCKGKDQSSFVGIIVNSVLGGLTGSVTHKVRVPRNAMPCIERAATGNPTVGGVSIKSALQEVVGSGVPLTQLVEMGIWFSLSVSPRHF